MFICGSIPYNNFTERLGIIKGLKKEFKRVKITVLDNLIIYEAKANKDVI